MSADGNDSPAGFLSDDERGALEQRWSQGRLGAHGERLLAFIDRHRDDLIKLAGDAPTPADLLGAVKRLVMQVGAVHPRSEMDDQMREIHDEIWYCGERGDYDREKIKHDWTSRHAANWRRWRLKEYLFVADRLAPEILQRFRRE